jgi:hypothetical protein
VIESFSTNDVIRTYPKIYKSDAPYGWMEGNINGKKYYENKDYYEYKGEIIITKEEIDKYNIERDVKRYNL